MTLTEIVRVVVEGVNKNLGKVMNKVKTSTNNASIELTNFSRVLSMTQQRFVNINKSGIQFTSMGGRVANSLRMMTTGLRGFRMELLGVMFFGMQMSMVFGQMLRPAAETFGIFDLWTQTLQLLFLPVMQAIFPFLLIFMDFFMWLPEPVKMAVGVFALLGLAIGKVLFWIGTLGLGLGALFQTSAISIFTTSLKFIANIFFKISGIVTNLFTFLGAAGTATIALLITSIIGLWLAFQENFNNINQWAKVTWEGIKTVITGVINIIKGSFGLLWNIITFDLNGIKKSFSLIWNGIKQIVQGSINFMIGLMVTLGTGVLRGLKLVKDFFVDIFGEIVDNAVQWGIDIIDSIIEGMKRVGSKITSFIKSLIPKFGLGGGSDDPAETGQPNRNPTLNDFIIRPGQSPIAINPNDNIIGFKGDNSPIGGNITINQNNTISGTLMDDIDRMLRENNSRMVDEVKRLTGA